MSIANTLFIIFFSFIFVGCSGSPARVSSQTPQELREDELVGMTPGDLCKRMIRVEKRVVGGSGSSITQEDWEGKNWKATKLELVHQGYDARYCKDPERYKVPNVDQEVYNIDTLRVTTQKLKTAICASGGIHKIILEGTISPDSSFAMEKLLKRSPHCRNNRGQVIVATTVQLESGGGYLVDGYKLGRSLRKAGATTVIENQQGCASSCAVAFLGGKKRVVEDTGAIMFHAPYFSGKNAYGVKIIDCDIPEPDLKILNNYYAEMVGKEAGDRLYERTIWYCSAEDGWVVTGGSAAELYDIATEK